MPIILAAWEAEIRRTEASPGGKVHEILFQSIKAGMVA
jgi:hypothetical protein